MNEPSHCFSPALGARSLALRGITMSLRGKTLFSDASYQFNSGFCCLIGRNGSGKSTLLRILAGVLRPDSGKLELGTEELHPNDELRRRIGYVPHRPALYPALSVHDNLSFWGRVMGLTSSEVANQIESMSDWFDIRELLPLKAGTLSRGQQQAVSLVRGFSANTDILLLDEPYTGLDTYAQDALTSLLQAKSTDGTIIVATMHDLNLVADLADDVVVIKGRQLVEVGRPKIRRDSVASDDFINHAKQLQEIA